jgi:putative lipoic acid-binding regulatory protein
LSERQSPPEAGGQHAASDVDRAIELLEANHEFPGPYSLSVIALAADEVTARVLAVVEGVLGAPPTADDHQRVPSSGGKYLSHRMTVQVSDARQVLAIYAGLREVQGVFTVL